MKKRIDLGNGVFIDIDDPVFLKQQETLSEASRLGAMNQEEDAKAIEKLTDARIGLLFRGMSFYGTMALDFVFVNGDTWIETIGCDYPRVYYNSKWLNTLTTQEVMFTLGALVISTVLEHTSEDRINGRDTYMWNNASNIVICNELQNQNIGTAPKLAPVDHHYDNQPTEEVYDRLMAENPNYQPPTYIMSIPSDFSQGSLSSEHRSEMRRGIQQKIIQAAASAKAEGEQNTRIPGAVNEYVDSLSDPVMPWKELIPSVMSSLAGAEYSYLALNRSTQHLDAILPGLAPSEEIDVHIAIDTSGSMWSESIARDVLGEVKGITELFDGFKLHVYCFDTSVHNVKEYTSYGADNIDDYVLGGGGGTDFMAIWDYLKETDQIPKHLIVLTDMCPGGEWGDPEYCPTTWIGYGTTSIKPPFGTYAYYDDHA